MTASRSYDGLEAVRGALPDLARDVKLNLQTVLADGSLSPGQRWGVAVASAAAARHPGLLEAVLADARRAVDEPVVEDALAAAALMGMNNVYYRFRHVVGKPAVLGEAGAPAHEPPRQARHEQGRLRAFLAGGLGDQRLRGLRPRARKGRRRRAPHRGPGPRRHTDRGHHPRGGVALEIAESPGPVPATEAVALV